MENHPLLVDAEDTDETPTTTHAAFSQLSYVRRLVEDHTENINKIPAIKAEVEYVSKLASDAYTYSSEARERGSIAKAEVKNVSARVDRLVDDLGLDQKQGVRTREMVKGLQEDVTDIKVDFGEFSQKSEKSQSTFLKTIIVAAVAIIIAIVGGMSGLSFSIGSLEAGLEGEQQVRSTEINGIKDRLDRMPTKDEPSITSKTLVHSLQLE
jgi:hypothetical protein